MKNNVEKLFSEYKERTKELTCINQTTRLINQNLPINKTLQMICDMLPAGWQYPEFAVAKIEFAGKVYTTTNYKKTMYEQKESFSTADNMSGYISICYLKKFPEADEGPFLKQERDLISNLAAIISGGISKKLMQDIVTEREERVKELKGINYASKAFRKNEPLGVILQRIVNYLPNAWQYPKYTVLRIKYDDAVYQSKKFTETRWVQRKCFTTLNDIKGVIEVFYTQEFPEAYEGPFLREERNLINNIAIIISSSINQRLSQQLFYEHKERLKELQAINKTAEILGKSESVQDALEKICEMLPKAFQFPDFTVVCINYDNDVYQSDHFKKTKWSLIKEFESTAGKKGAIEIYYLKEFPLKDEGPFLEEERHMINNIAGLIAGETTRFDFKQLMENKTEREKELGAINQTTKIISQGGDLDRSLKKIVNVITGSWQYPDHTVARIIYDDKEYLSDRFKESDWKQEQSFVTIENKEGKIEVFYLVAFPELDEGPFLKEERDLINNLATVVAGYINSIKGKDKLEQLSVDTEQSFQRRQVYTDVLQDKEKPLPSIYDFFQKRAMDKYIYLDLMRFKIKEILFVASLYDAFILDYEEGFFKNIMGEVYKYGIFSIPRITKVTSSDEARSLVDKTRFDMVIIMPSSGMKESVKLANDIKTGDKNLSVFFLINRKDELKGLLEQQYYRKSIDKIFTWNGDSRIVFSMVKTTEDRINADNDTKVGNVCVILLVEDSPVYSSRFINALYSIVFDQVQYAIEEETNELDKISKIRLRPKILHASNYEEAVYYIDQYKDNLFWVVSDVEFEKNEQYNKQAGVQLINYLKKTKPGVPVLVQSSNPDNEGLSNKYNISFINKDTDNLTNELRSFVNENLGFGAFQFKNKKGETIDEALTLEEFRRKLLSVADDTVIYHSQNDHFSRWLLARGDIMIANLLKPIKHTDFEGISEFKGYFLETIEQYIEDKNKGKIINYEHTLTGKDKNILSLANGSLGGKGRGLAFIDTMINNMDDTEINQYIKLNTPKTAVIGTDEYEEFINRNDILNKIRDIEDDQSLKKIFSDGKLSEHLKGKLKTLLADFNKPMAIRSSSLFEDSLSQPFSGVFDTYILPNNGKQSMRLSYLCQAVKLVYASVFTQKATNYFRSVNFKRESEKMAVIIQELVGLRYDNYYYPHISGVAQSYNYYPVSHMNPEEGVALLAIGLGEQIVSGQKSYRFSPVYPDSEINTAKDLLNNSQTSFFAVNMSKNDVDLVREGENAFLDKNDLYMAEKHGVLKHLVSTYDHDNQRIVPGTDIYGPRIANFPNILKYEYIPLSKGIEKTLMYASESLGFPVIIEFALNLDKDENNQVTLYLLQVKPLIGENLHYEINVDKHDKNNMLLYTGSMIGNGKIDDIYDVIFVDREHFDKTETQNIAREMESLNKKMTEKGVPYILIGPGRWGSRDENVGIPVTWGQISNAKVIVEISLDHFSLDASFGSHFFHNVTAMNVGYFSVQYTSQTDFIRWEMLENMQYINQTKYLRHVRFNKPLVTYMDGKNRLAIIEVDPSEV